MHVTNHVRRFRSAGSGAVTVISCTRGCTSMATLLSCISRHCNGSSPRIALIAKSTNGGTCSHESRVIETTRGHVGRLVLAFRSASSRPIRRVYRSVLNDIAGPSLSTEVVLSHARTIRSAMMVSHGSPSHLRVVLVVNGNGRH